MYAPGKTGTGQAAFHGDKILLVYVAKDVNAVLTATFSLSSHLNVALYQMIAGMGEAASGGA